MSLYNKYRPSNFNELLGNTTNFVEYTTKEHNHALLFHGPPGCGKTTAALLLAKQVGAEETDIITVNCGDKTGVDNLRDTLDKRHYQPWGKAWVFIFNECQQLTDNALQLLLDPIEFVEDKVYYIFTTSRLSDLSGKKIETWATLRTRLHAVEFKAIDSDTLYTLVKKVAESENITLDKQSCLHIAEIAKGSARKALVLLEQALLQPLDKRSQYVLSLRDDESEVVEIIDLCRCLYSNGTWQKAMHLVTLLKETTEAEQVRRTLLSYGCKILSMKLDSSVIGICHFLQETCYTNGWSDLIVMLGKAFSKRESK